MNKIKMSIKNATFLCLIVMPCLIFATKTSSQYLFKSSTTNTVGSTNIKNTNNDKIIYLTEKSSQSIRLKSVRSILELNGQTSPKSAQKIFWSFKRIYSIPKFINEIQTANETNLFVKSKNELSQLELMISLDAEVQDNLKDKYSIDEVSKYDLIIQNLTYADMGLYKCNLWNQKTIYYYLTVLSPISKPEIDYENKMMIESTNVSMSCMSKQAYPYPNIKWFRNDKEIKINSENDITISYNSIDKETNAIESVLTIRNVTNLFHLNNFTCKLVQIQDQTDDENNIKLNELSIESEQNLKNIIETRLNSSKLSDEFASKQQFWQSSKSVTLNIGFKPILNVEIFNKDSNSKLFTSFDNKLILFNNSDIIFNCFYKSNPIEEIKIQWLINNQPQIETDSLNKNIFKWLQRSNRYENNLKKMNLTCEISNSIGKSTLTHEITILYEPMIKCDKKVYDVDESNPLQVNCFIDASPPVISVEWKHYLQNTSDIFQSVTNSSVLDFKSVKYRENSGFYECVAKNLMKDSFEQSRIGKTLNRIELNVRFMPQINVIAKKMAANLSESTHAITCMTMSNPQPEFKWYKNDMKLFVNSSKYITTGVVMRSKNLYENTLIINDLDAKNDLNKIYKCEAFNLLGLNKLEVELVPLSKPDKPTELRVLYVDFMTITLAWSAGFDGGFDQNFTIEINDTQFEIDSNGTTNNIKHIKYGPSLLNLTYLNYNTAYSIRLIAKNEMGSSEWSDYLMVKTIDLTQNDTHLLPEFDSLFLNVPKNRFEFNFRNNNSNFVPICLHIKALMNSFKSDKYLNFEKCLPFNYLINQRQFSFDNLKENDLNLIEENDSNKTEKSFIFQANKVKSIKVSICFQINSNICASSSTNAIIDTYNKISHSSLKSDKNKPNDFDSVNFSSTLSRLSNNSSIPVALIIGICVCILSLLILLFVTVIYCIRKRNFKLCKALLSSPADLNNKKTLSDCEKNEKSLYNNPKASNIDVIDHKRTLSHTNKSFNVDIASISAPMASVVSINGSQMTNSSSSELNALSNSNVNSNMNTNTIRRGVFTANLTTTASNIIGKHVNKINEILVTEDEDKHLNYHQLKQHQLNQQHNDMLEENKSSSDSGHGHGQISSSNTSSTGVSNCSSIANGCNNVIGPFIYNDFNPFDHTGVTQSNANGLTFIDTYNSGASGASSGSNSDPIAINNSLSSNSTSDSSPTYGYNVASAAQHQQQHHSSNSEVNSNLLFIKTAYQTNHSHTTFPPINLENNFQQILFHQQSSMNSLKNNFSSSKMANSFSNHNQSMNATSSNNSYEQQQQQQQQSESGFSTPSRPKKVVYEVIV